MNTPKKRGRPSTKKTIKTKPEIAIERPVLTDKDIAAIGKLSEKLYRSIRRDQFIAGMLAGLYKVFYAICMGMSVAFGVMAGFRMFG